MYLQVIVPWSCAVFGAVSDIPGIYGPVLTVTNATSPSLSSYLKGKPGGFVHSDIWHSHNDLETIRNSVRTSQSHGTQRMSTSRLTASQSPNTLQGPKAVLARGVVSNYSSFTNDARAAWQNSLMWYITKDRAHWTRATTILDSWGTNLTNIIGVDRSLLIGLEGVLFVNAAEIMRWKGGWTELGYSWRGGSGFSAQLYWLFSRQSVVVGQANYGMVSIQALLAFAVYLDDVSLYNHAINEYINNPCAGLPSQYHPVPGQSVEAGRDQGELPFQSVRSQSGYSVRCDTDHKHRIGHTQSGLGWTAYGARVAHTQRSDLWSLNDNILLKGAEYAAAFNLNQSFVHNPSWYRCEAVPVGGPWANISSPQKQYCFDLVCFR